MSLFPQIEPTLNSDQSSKILLEKLFEWRSFEKIFKNMKVSELLFWMVEGLLAGERNASGLFHPQKGMNLAKGISKIHFHISLIFQSKRTMIAEDFVRPAFSFRSKFKEF